MKQEKRSGIPIIEAMETRLLMSTDNVLVHSTQNLPSGASTPIAVAVGNKVLFASDAPDEVDFYNVDIYNTSTGLWSTTSLSQARSYLSAVVVGNEALFAGGRYFPRKHSRNSDVVDIFNARLNRWSVTHLPVAASSMESTSDGNLAVFCNGIKLFIYNTSTRQWTTAPLPESVELDNNMVSVDGKIVILEEDLKNNYAQVYDPSTGIWSTTMVSSTSLHMVATTVENLAMFAGGSTLTGWSNVVDIYNAVNGDWSTATLSSGRDGIDATTLDNLALFAGGEGPFADGGMEVTTTNTADIYNSKTGQWSTTAMTVPLQELSSASIGDMEIFGGGLGPFSYPIPDSHVEIFDTDTMQWSTLLLSQNRNGVSAASANGTALFAGGYPSFDSNPTSVVDLFTLPEINTKQSTIRNQTTIKLTNAGSSALPADTELAVFGSTSRVFEDNSVLFGRVLLRTPLAVGASETISVPLSIPAGTSAGQYHLITTLGPSHERVQIASTRHTFTVTPTPAAAAPNMAGIFNSVSPIIEPSMSATEDVLPWADETPSAADPNEVFA